MNRPLITEHAILRFAERALDFDRAPIEILIRDAVGSAKAGLFKLPGYDLYARVVNNAVVTIVPLSIPELRPKRKKKPKIKKPIEDIAPENWMANPAGAAWRE